VVLDPAVHDRPALDATGLAHPLLDPAKAVRNDVALGALGEVLLVTGSNMSGKSTLLRAMGTNVVLALAGAPVRATGLRTLPFDVRTSMRIRDDLHAGVSHFFAELRRLKEVVDVANDDAATRARPVLYLLDEILHGTNSRERHLGAAAIVRHLTERRACGAVSTHDLALGALEQELAGKLRNVHFEEQVRTAEDGTETMSFDYRLRSGVVASSNALRLMRIVGIDVPLPIAKSVPPPASDE
jgi:DNA mismatch repair ATPase MutS